MRRGFSADEIEREIGKSREMQLPDFVTYGREQFYWMQARPSWQPLLLAMFTTFPLFTTNPPANGLLSYRITYREGRKGIRTAYTGRFSSHTYAFRVSFAAICLD